MTNVRVCVNSGVCGFLKKNLLEAALVPEPKNALLRDKIRARGLKRKEDIRNEPGASLLAILLLTAVLISPLAIAGCATHTYRVYDSYYSDYHIWDRNEVVFYNRWEVETRREHREFRRRSPEEQREYWTWRHSHH